LTGNNELVEEVDEKMALRMLYDGAIYPHARDTYRVSDFLPIGFGSPRFYWQNILISMGMIYRTYQSAVCLGYDRECVDILRYVQASLPCGIRI